MVPIESVEQFKEACYEIHLLLKYSKNNSKDFKKYATFNKAAIVLLCAKFEAFFETFLAEYADYHLNNSSNHTLDRHLYHHMIDCIVINFEINKMKAETKQDMVSKLEALCGGTEIRPIVGYHTDPKLKFGKHGQREIERLLKVFGFSEYAGLERVKSFFITFNSLNSIRNNIIHEDATPSLTHQDVKIYLDSIIEFINGLEILALSKMTLAV